jgi:hypothetical protein
MNTAKKPLDQGTTTSSQIRMSKTKEPCSQKNNKQQWFELTTEHRLIQVMSSSQKGIREESIVYTLRQRSIPRDSGNCGNRIWQCCGPMKEYKSIEVMNTPQRLIRQESKDANPLRM